MMVQSWTVLGWRVRADWLCQGQREIQTIIGAIY